MAIEGNESRLGSGGYPLSAFANYSTKIPFVLGQYRLLEPHYFAASGWRPAGAIVIEGADVPIGWVPTLAVDPLNNPAVNAFYNAGPRSNAYEDLNMWARGTPQDGPMILSPVTFWIQSGNAYSLTGLGSGFPPIGIS
jgi:hypothetical protein